MGEGTTDTVIFWVVSENGPMVGSVAESHRIEKKRTGIRSLRKLLSAGMREAKKPMRAWLDMLANLRRDPKSQALALRLGSLAAIIFALFFVSSVAQFTFYQRSPNDFAVYVRAAEALRDGGNIYSVTIPVQSFGLGELPLRYLYPPPLAALLCLLLPLGTAALDSLWIALSVASILAVAWAMRAEKLVTSLGVGWIAVCLTFWPPTIDGFEAGQVNALVLALLAAFLVALQQGRFMLAGWALGGAVMLKVTPIFLALLLLSRDAAPARKHLALSLAAISLLALAAFGSGPWIDFVAALPAISSGAEVWMNRSNLALSRFLFDAIPGISRADALLVQRIVVVLSCCLSGYRALQWGRAGFTRCFSAMLLVMVLSAPVIWFNHLLWCAFPIVTSWNCTRGSPVLRSTVFLCALAITASRFVDMYLQLHGASGAVPGGAMLSAAALALIIILSRQRPAFAN